MRNPFADRAARRQIRRQERAETRARVESTPKKQLLSPDGLRVVEFSTPIQSMLRLYGVGGNYASIYASQPNVSTAIKTIAREAASLALKTYFKDDRADAPTSRVEVSDEPLARLLGQPSGDVEPRSLYDFWFALFADLEIYDIAYLMKVRRAGVPAALVDRKSVV